MTTSPAENPLWQAVQDIDTRGRLMALRINTLEQFVARVRDPIEREHLAAYLLLSDEEMQRLVDDAELTVNAPKDEPRKVTFGALKPDGCKR